VETANIQATIFYRHSPEEVRALEAATIPMVDHIRAVCGNLVEMRQIFGGKYFRYGQARATCTILLRATRHARAHLDDYFPMMREQIIADTEKLEEAVKTYWHQFEKAHNQLAPAK
jgi:hypothetical protein